MIYAPAGLLPGILSPSSEKGSPSPAGIYSSFPAGIFIPTGQTLTAAASVPATRKPAIGNAIRRRALRISLASQHDAYFQPTAKSGRRRARVSTAV